MILFDSHCHLQDQRILPDVKEVIARARQAGVLHMLCCGSAESDWEAVRDLAGQYPEIVPAFGLHPWYVAERSGAWLEKLEAILARTPGAAIGEIGLDHALDKRNDGEQALVFLAQLKLSRKLDRPVSIHCRKAWGDMMGILRQQCGTPGGGVLHSYSGPSDLIREIEALNVSVSFSGSITYDRNRRGRAALAEISEGHLLLETDAPDIPPAGVEAGANEPANLVTIAGCVAGLRGRAVEEIAELTTANGLRLFGRYRP